MDIHHLGDHQEVIPVLAVWIYDEWSYLYPGITLRDIEGFLRERVNKQSLPLTLVALDSGEPVGTVSLKPFEMETRTDLTPWVVSLYVAKPWRRRRIGSALMKTIEQKAASLDFRKLFLFVADNALAGLFYAKLGWVIRENATYHSYPVIIMEKEVA